MRAFLVRCFCLFVIPFSLFASDFWTHLELGAGNYGKDGHTKASLAMTIFQKFKYVSPKKNFVDDLEERGSGNYKPEEQYAILFWTLDELVKRYGEVGVFHVNDLCEEYAVFAAEKLQDYARAQGYKYVTIEAIAGDYTWIDPRVTLAPYGKILYSSAHLKNPEVTRCASFLKGKNRV